MRGARWARREQSDVMEYVRVTAWILLPVLLPPALLRDVDALDYCEAETFKTSCNEGEVVVMTSADYGRMTTGRCVLKDYGYVGCRASVLAHMDRLCSGRRACAVRIPDPALDRSNPCPRDFKTYLRADYKCIPVERERCASCAHARELRLQFSQGFLSSVEAYSSGCGTVTCPWHIEVAGGRRINLTLYDFTAATRHRAVRRDFGLGDMCHRLATVRDVTHEHSEEDAATPICAGGARERHVFTSAGSHVTVELKRRDQETFGHYIIRYTAIGCADLPTRDHVLVTRDGDEAQVECRANGKRVTLRCTENKWKGPTLDCPGFDQSSSTMSADRLPLSLVVTVVVAIALVIGVCILVAGLVFMKRRHRNYSTSHVITTTGRPRKGVSSPGGRPVNCHQSVVKIREAPPTYDDVAGPMYQVPYSLAQQYLEYQLGTRPLPDVPPVVPRHRNTHTDNEYEEYADYDVSGHTYHQVDGPPPHGVSAGLCETAGDSPLRLITSSEEDLLSDEPSLENLMDPADCQKSPSVKVTPPAKPPHTAHTQLTPFQMALLLDNNGTTSWP